MTVDENALLAAIDERIAERKARAITRAADRKAARAELARRRNAGLRRRHSQKENR